MMEYFCRRERVPSKNPISNKQSNFHIFCFDDGYSRYVKFTWRERLFLFVLRIVFTCECNTHRFRIRVHTNKIYIYIHMDYEWTRWSRRRRRWRWWWCLLLKCFQFSRTPAIFFPMHCNVRCKLRWRRVHNYWNLFICKDSRFMQRCKKFDLLTKTYWVKEKICYIDFYLKCIHYCLSVKWPKYKSLLTFILIAAVPGAQLGVYKLGTDVNSCQYPLREESN